MTGFRAMESEQVGSGLFVLFFSMYNCMQFHKHVLVKVATKFKMASSRLCYLLGSCRR